MENLAANRQFTFRKFVYFWTRRQIHSPYKPQHLAQPSLFRKNEMYWLGQNRIHLFFDKIEKLHHKKSNMGISSMNPANLIVVAHQQNIPFDLYTLLNRIK